MTRRHKGCPATYWLDQGDYAEPDYCALPIEHNADDDPWHECSSETNNSQVTVRWRTVDKPDLKCAWPPPKNAQPDPLLIKRFMSRLALTPLDRITVCPPRVGTRVKFRKWASISTPPAE